MTPAAAPSPLCPLHLDTQIALHTLALKTCEEDIEELKGGQKTLAEAIGELGDKFAAKVDRILWALLAATATFALGAAGVIVTLLSQNHK